MIVIIFSLRYLDKMTQLRKAISNEEEKLQSYREQIETLTHTAKLLK
jgi:hypothetical protein